MYKHLLKKALFCANISFLFVSCNKENSLFGNFQIKGDPLKGEVVEVKNLHAPGAMTISGGSPAKKTPVPVFTKFNFFTTKKGQELSGENWHVAFRGSTIAINGGNKPTKEIAPKLKRKSDFVEVKVLIKAFGSVSLSDVQIVGTFEADGNDNYALTLGGLGGHPSREGGNPGGNSHSRSGDTHSLVPSGVSAQRPTQDSSSEFNILEFPTEVWDYEINREKKTHFIKAKPGVTLVFKIKERDTERYIKMQIKSFYKNGVLSINAEDLDYLSFNYQILE